MAMRAKEVIKWLQRLKPDRLVGIADGGLLLATINGEEWLEIGGLPEGSKGADA